MWYEKQIERIVTRKRRALLSTNLPWPTDWAAYFDQERPLILDIGFGYGHTLAYLQAARPDHNIVGIEIDNISLQKAERRVAREGWKNVVVAYSFAETALHHLFVPGSLQEVHVNFPDPWFKARHARRRVMQRDTLDAIVSRLKPGGFFYLATDIAEYAEMSHELLAATPGLDNVFDSPWVSQRPEPFTTKYERRALEEARTCYYFKVVRNQQPPPDVPVIQEEPMPNVVFQSSLSLDYMMQQAEPDSYSQHDTSVTFMDRYRGERSVLFEVFVHDPTLDQRLAIALVEKQDEPGTFTLKMGALGHPRPTKGVHRAMRLLTDALETLDPDMHIIHDKVQR